MHPASVRRLRRRTRSPGRHAHCDERAARKPAPPSATPPKFKPPQHHLRGLRRRKPDRRLVQNAIKWRKHLMQFLRSILTKAFHPAAVKSAATPAEISVAVRPITGLRLAAAVTVRRLTLVAWFASRRAVRANIPELDYLRTQHALYRAT